MPSRTPETLTAVQRAQRLNLPPNDKKGAAGGLLVFSAISDGTQS